MPGIEGSRLKAREERHMEAGPWQDLPGMASLLEMAVTPLRTGTWPSLPSPVTG